MSKPKQFDVDGWTVTVSAEDWPRVRPLIRLMRATPGPVFLVNLGSATRPAYQPLTQFIAQGSALEYWVLRDRSDPADHRRSNLVRA